VEVQRPTLFSAIHACPVQHRSEPDTAARNFLVTVARNPNAVRQALAKEKPGGL
jgi:hypothetical protein